MAKKDYMTQKEAAEFLGMSPQTVYRYCKNNILPFYKVGPRKRFKKEELEQFLKGAHCNAPKTGRDPFNTD